MLDWIAMALMTGAAVMAVLWPLSRKSVSVSERSTDTGFYRSQLAEIARDVERGVISEADAEAARAEAGRRLLHATAGQVQAAKTEDVSPSLTRSRIAALMAIVLVPLVTFLIYARTGAPGMPDMPLSARLETPAQQDVPALLARVEKRLAEQPDDLAGWQVIAPVYMAAERYDDAVRAYSNILRLAGPDGERFASLGEAMIAQAGGVVTADARKAIDQALAVSPNLMSARYYRAMALEQDGKGDEALGVLKALLVDMPSQAPASQVVRERIAMLEGQPAIPQGGDAVAAMPEAERIATIRGMVEALNQRLTDTGGNADEWIRLIRSYVVLGNRDRAKDALSRARANLKADAPSLARLETLARDSGVE